MYFALSVKKVFNDIFPCHRSINIRCQILVFVSGNFICAQFLQILVHCVNKREVTQ